MALVATVLPAAADAPVAILHADRTVGEVPLAVAFSLQTHPSSHGPITHWQLVFGDGAPPTSGTGDPDGRVEAHTYQQVGDFDAVFTVYDATDHGSDRVSIHTSPANLPPHDLVLAPSPTSGRARSR